MARFPIYEQQTTAQGPRASGAEFGAETGQAMAQAGNVLQDIGVTMKRREDVIDRIRIMNDMDAFAIQSLEALQPEDISNKATVDKYSQALRQKADEMVRAHPGTSGSRAELQAQIDNMVGQYEKSAITTQIKAQHAMISNRVDQRTNSYAAQATLAPQMMPEIFQQFEADLGQFAEVLSPQQLDAYRVAGRSKIVTGTVSSLLTRGQTQAAKEIMNNPEMTKLMGPDTSRKFAIDIAVDEGKAAAETARQDKNVQRMALMAGRDLTPEEVMKARMLPEKKDMTPADEIVELELVQGKPATQTQIDKIYGTYVDGGAAGDTQFGNSLKGRAISYVTNNATAAANGLLTPEEFRQFAASYNEAYGPQSRKDPVTGAWEQTSPSVPLFAKQAMDKAAAFYGPGLTAQTAPNRPVTMGQPMPGQTVQLDINGQPVGRGVVDQSGTWNIPVPPEQQGGMTTGGEVTSAAEAAQPTIWEMAPDIAGPTPAITTAIGAVPYVGSMVGGGGQTATNRSYLRTQISQMVDALSINPRNPVALVEMIRKEIDVDPKIMDDPAAFRKRIEGVNRSLTERLLEETAAANNPDLPAKTRQDALDVANTIANFQRKLMPPQVKNAEEARQLPPGTKFLTPDGRLLQR